MSEPDHTPDTYAELLALSSYQHCSALSHLREALREEPDHPLAKALEDHVGCGSLGREVVLRIVELPLQKGMTLRRAANIIAELIVLCAVDDNVRADALIDEAMTRTYAQEVPK